MNLRPIAARIAKAGITASVVTRAQQAVALITLPARVVALEQHVQALQGRVTTLEQWVTRKRKATS